MKKLLAIALIASLTTGSALQAKHAKKEAPKPAKQRWYSKPMITPTKPITDPKELNKQIRTLNSKIRKIEGKRRRFIADRTKAANDGDMQQVQALTNKIKHKDAKLRTKRAMLHMYTMRLVALKSAEMKKEKKETKRAKAPKTKKAKHKKSK